MAVVDLGDGERWLAPAHALAWKPLLLWRAPWWPRHASAPQWLEKRQAYVLAGHSLLRLYQFLKTDTHNATVVNGQFHRSLKLDRQQLQLSTTAPIVLSTGVPEVDLELECVPKILRSLWQRHQNFRGLLLVETHSSKWTGFAVSTILQNNTIVIHQGTIESAVHFAIRTVETACSNNNARPITMYFDTNSLVSRTHVDGKQNDTSDVVFPPVFHQIDVLAKKFNFTLTSYPQVRGHDLVKILHAVPLLVKREIDVYMEPIMMIGDSTELSLLTATVQWDGMLILTPWVQKPKWSLLFRVFGWNIWTALIGCAVAYAAGWRLLTGDGVITSAVVALRAFSSSAGPPQGRITKDSQRVQLTGALIGSALIIVSVYQSRMYTLLVCPEHYQSQKSFKELLSSSLEIVSTELILLFKTRNKALDVNNNQSSSLPLMTFESTNLLTERMASQEQFAWCTKESFWDMYKDVLNLKNRWKPLHEAYFLPETFIHTPRNWPWTNDFNIAIHHLNDAGLNNHWEDLIRWQMIVNIQMKPNNRSIKWMGATTVDGPFTFKLTDISYQFLILGIGVLIAFVVFICERCQIYFLANCIRKTNPQLSQICAKLYSRLKGRLCKENKF